MNLKELARHLELSPTTVSRALNGYPEVSDATRGRVQEAARALGYRPSLAARRLATGRSHTIGHLIPRSQQGLLGPHFADIVAGLSEGCARLGYDTLLAVVDDAEEAARYREAAASGRVDGFVLHGPRVEEPRLRLLESLGLPFVVHGRTGDPTGYDWLDVDNRDAARRATAFLLDLGHRDIALLNGDETFNYARLRREGFVEAFAARDLALPAPRLFQGELTEAYGYEATVALLERPPAPTALVASGLLVAFGAQRALAARGLEAGRELSVVAYDDRISWLPNGGGGSDGGSVPLFTTLRSSIRRAACRLVERLDARIRAPDAPPTGELWDVELVLGRSTGPPPLGPRAKGAAGRRRRPRDDARTGASDPRR